MKNNNVDKSLSRISKKFGKYQKNILLLKRAWVLALFYSYVHFDGYIGVIAHPILLFYLS
jgi:hypothetical protein